MKKVSCLIIIFALMISSPLNAFAAVNFSDTPTGAWYYDYVDTLVNKGAINGYPDGTFRPQGTITVAEFMKIVVSLIDGEKAKTGNHWASGYLDYANNAKIMFDSGLTQSGYDAPIKREEIAAVLINVTNNVFTEESVPQKDTDAAKESFTDFNKVSVQYQTHVAAATVKGLILGYDDRTFRPQNTATRAEATALIVRLIDVGKRQPMSEKALLSDLVDLTNNELISSKRLGDVSLTGLQTMLKGISYAEFIQDGSAYLLGVLPGNDPNLVTYKGINIYLVALIRDNKVVDVLGFLPSGKDYLQAIGVTKPNEFEYVLSYEPTTKEVIYFKNPLMEMSI